MTWKVLDLFSGIGGFSLGLEPTGQFQTVAFVEIDPYCRRVLAKNWPAIPIYRDVKNVTAARLRSDGINADIITGGFPCQDLSVAGKQAGIEGGRSGLWDEQHRIISEVRPRYAIVENVTALLAGDGGRWFGRVLGDLAEIGYDCEWHCIPASAVGAPHRRDRVWIIAYPGSSRARLEAYRCCGQGRKQTDTFESTILRQANRQARPERAAAGCENVAKTDELNDDGGRHRASAIRGKRSPAPDISRSKIVADADISRRDPGNRVRRCQARSRSKYRDHAERRGGETANSDSVRLQIRTDRPPSRKEKADEARSETIGASQSIPDTDSRLRPLRRDAGRMGWVEKPGARRCGSDRNTESRMGLLAYGLSVGLARSEWLPEPGIGRIAVGVPDRVAKLKTLGNAIVPAMATIIGQAIIEREKDE